MAKEHPTAQALIERLHAAHQKAGEQLGMPFTFSNLTRKMGSIVDEISREISNHLRRPDVDLQQLDVPGVEKAIRFDPTVLARLESKIRDFEQDVDRLITEKH